MVLRSPAKRGIGPKEILEHAFGGVCIVVITGGIPAAHGGTAVFITHAEII